MNLGKIIKVTGLVLGTITIFVGFFVFFALGDSRSTRDMAWIGLMISMSGFLEGVVLAGFGKLVEDVSAMREKLCGAASYRDNELPEL